MNTGCVLSHVAANKPVQCSTQPVSVSSYKKQKSCSVPKVTCAQREKLSFSFNAISTLVTPTLVCWTYPETRHDRDRERCSSQTPRSLGIVDVGLVRPDRSAVRFAGDHHGYDEVLLRCVSSRKFNSIQSGEPPLKSSGKGEVYGTKSPPVEDV